LEVRGKTKPLKQRETLAVTSRIYIYSKLEKANKKETRQIFVDRAIKEHFQFGMEKMVYSIR
jgi:hypothetical protein